jgi:plastocyanin
MTRRVFAGAVLFVVAASTPCTAGNVAGKVSLGGEPTAEVVVSLRSRASSGAQPAPTPSESTSTGTAAPVTAGVRRAVMDQKHLAFLPGVLPVLRGTVVAFTNSDDVEHNVFSPSAVAGEFDLGTYASGEAREIALDNPGEVHILCNIHMEMEAHILVLEEPWFATTAADGSFSIGDVPAGDYDVAVWRDGWLPERRAITVPAAGEVRADVAVH